MRYSGDDRRRDSRRRRLHVWIRAIQSLVAMVIAGALAGNDHGGWAAAFFGLALYAMVAGIGAGFSVKFGRSWQQDDDFDDDGNANE
jgi:hypothetical protein